MLVQSPACYFSFLQASQHPSQFFNWLKIIIYQVILESTQGWVFKQILVILILFSFSFLLKASTKNLIFQLMVILFTLLQALDSPNFEISSLDVENHSFFTSTIQSQNETHIWFGLLCQTNKEMLQWTFFFF
jgi:hypothetical protein